MHRFDLLRVFSLMLLLALGTPACGDDSDDGPPAPGDGDGDGDAGDGDGGDGDGDGDVGDGDGDGDDTCESDSALPSDCRCTKIGGPCFSRCAMAGDEITVCEDSNDAGHGEGDDGGIVEDAGPAMCIDVLTCNDVCGADKCAANGCNGKTWLLGTEDACATPSEYNGTEAAGCADPIPFELTQNGETFEIGVTCCCRP